MDNKSKKKQYLNLAYAGVTSGFLNGLFGSGGGVVAVMFLRKIIGDEKKAHASATLMILVMSCVSLLLYALYGHVNWSDGLKFIPGGLIGSIIGTITLKKIQSPNLKKLFGLVLVISGTVMLFS